MEDYIYILLVLLWVVFSIVKATRKKPVAPSHETELEEYEETTSRPRGTFDELLEEFLGTENDKEKPYKQPQPVYTYDDPESFTPEIEQYEELSSGFDDANNLIEPILYSDEIPVTQDSVSAGDISKADMPEGIAFMTHANDRINFDLRNAVIYSAILIRPYD